MSKRADFLKWAADCVQIAQESRDANTKATMLAMAQAWIDLAEQARLREQDDEDDDD